MRKSISINVILKPISMIISLIYTPLLLSYLGNEQYGIWTTIMSVINWINLFDLGIGNGLRNVLTKEIALNKYKDANRSVSTAYFILTIIILLIFTLCTFIGMFLNWNSIFNTDLNIDIVLIISFTFICLNFILSLQKIGYYAIQKSEIVSVMGICVQLFNLVGIFSLFFIKTDKLISIASLFGLSSVLFNVLFSYVLWRKYIFLRPNIKKFDQKKLHSICDLGFKFFFIQIAGMILYSTDSIIISQLFSSSEVTPYNTVYKAFGIVFSLFQAALTPFWSRFTVAYNKKEYKWIKQTMTKFKLIWLCLSLVLIAILPIYQKISDIWLGIELTYDDGLILSMAIYYILYIYSSIYSTTLNGLGKINVQLIFSTIGAIINIPISIFLAKYCNLRTTGICIGTIISLLLGNIAYTIEMKKNIKKWKYQK